VIAFRRLASEDLPLVRGGSAATTPAAGGATRSRASPNADALAGLDATEYYVIELDGRPVGLIQTDVVADDRRSWRAFEKAGFRHVRDVQEDRLPHRLMRLDRRYAP
jgi:hypothetical protein